MDRIVESKYLSEREYKDYEEDKKCFYGKDARYEEWTNLEGDASHTIYKKRVTFGNEDSKCWGEWVEILEIWEKPTFEVLFTRWLGENVYEQTVKRTGKIITERLEYFVNGDGFKHFDGSRFVRSETTYKAIEVE